MFGDDVAWDEAGWIAGVIKVEGFDAGNEIHEICVGEHDFEKEWGEKVFAEKYGGMAVKVSVDRMNGVRGVHWFV